MKMNSKINIYKVQNLPKLDYICYNKIKSIPKKTLISKKSLKKLDISHCNNSIEILPKSNSKFKKTNTHSQPKPILSERIKRNYSNENQKEHKFRGIKFHKNNTYKINNTEINTLNNLISITNISLSPPEEKINQKIKNIFDRNILINNNNLDKKIIYLGEQKCNYNFKNEENNNKIAKSSIEILPYENNKIYENSKTLINKSQKFSNKKNKNHISLNLSVSSNNNKYKTLKKINNIKNKNTSREYKNLTGKLNQYFKEGVNLKIKQIFQNNGQNINNNKNLILKKIKRNNLSF